MVAAPAHRGADAGADHERNPPPTRDPLDMLVTSEPVTELDDALRCLGHQLRQARCRHDHDASTRLQRWIDGRLDERSTFRIDPAEPCRAREDR